MSTSMQLATPLIPVLTNWFRGSPENITLRIILKEGRASCSPVIIMSLADRVKKIFKHETGESSSKKMPATATVNGVVIAETDNYETVEGNVYFPPDSLKKEYFKSTETHTVCGWKGTASYYTIDVNDGAPLTDAAWYYPTPKDAASNIKDYVAFYKNKVKISS